METTDLTPGTLRELRAPRPYPAVSLAMPTHRREPDKGQDPVRLRNLVAEAKHRLVEDPDVSRQARFAVQEQLYVAVSRVDLRHALDGLLIFADAMGHQLWSLPRSVPERVILSDTFLTRNLVSARLQEHPYWVLAVAADRATLWSGSGEAIRRETVEGFPLTVERESPPNPSGVERKEQIGDFPSTFRDERTRQFLRAVDTAVAAVLARDPRPLFLIGLAPALAAFQEAGAVAHSAAGRVVKGGLVNGPSYALLQELRPAVEGFVQRQNARVQERIEDARGRRSFAAGLDEVWEAAREGRCDLLAVEEHYWQAVQVTEGHLIPISTGRDGSSAASNASIREDIVDEVVEAALDTGTEVVFLSDDALLAHNRIAAVLRY